MSDDMDKLLSIEANQALQKLGIYRRKMRVNGKEDVRAAVLDAALTVLRADLRKLTGRE